MGARRDSARWPLVGRESELGGFQSAWARLRCSGVVIHGAAGVGKSRLAEEFFAEVVRDGWQGARATASAAAAGVPLGAIAHLIPRGVDLSDPAQGFAHIVKLMGAGERQRVVLVNDLHLLDAASAVLLRQMLDARVLRLVGTVRSGSPLSEAVGDLCDLGGLSSIELEALDRDRIAAVLRAALDGEVGRHTVQELFVASAGNLLYLRELVAGALASGALSSDGEIWELSEGGPSGTPKLTELISARLVSAGPEARAALELIALCEPLALADAKAVASADLVTKLEDGGLVQLAHDGHRATIALAHPLYGEVLRAATPMLRRRALLLNQVHRAESHGGRRHDDPLRIATWRLAATGTADPQQLIRAASLARHAHDYDHVILLLQALPADQQTTATRLLFGEAQYELGNFGRAETVLEDAGAHTTNEAESLAVVMERTQNLFWGLGMAEEALRINKEAESTIADPIAHSVLAINRGAMLVFSGDPLDGLELLEDVEKMPDIRARVYGMALKVVGLGSVGRAADAVSLGERAYREHMSADSDVVLHHPTAQLPGLVEGYSALGQLTHARLLAEQGLEVAVDTRTRTSLLYVLAMAEWMSGNLGEARRSFAEACSLARDRNTWLLRSASSGLAACSAILGDISSAESAISGLEGYPQVAHIAADEYLGRAWILGASGKTAEARKVLHEGARAAQAAGRLTSEAKLLTEIARLGGAEECADRLTALADLCDGPLASARAHFAVALTQSEPVQLLAAANELEGLGAHLVAAEACGAAAVAWQQRGNPRQAATAIDQAKRYAGPSSGAHTPMLTFTDTATPLTPREHEVAVLAASGSDSKAIAKTLGLSVRTVNNHLQHAYTKLGVTNRQQLTETMQRHRTFQ
ncbi:LuxR C-terminal-related transcriptional regulator [Streptomyces sp. NPDC056480]|uniref:helix-turn-helix transcriptional regulator n=1 Tax=Streptomyces sp. NPDC056480 TaxID=3345833 RepID=UPI003682A507